MDITKKHISRRTVATGVAWTVPAVAVASTVPAFAASPEVAINLRDGHKHPGGSQRPCRQGYSFTATISGGGSGGTITFGDAYFNNTKLDDSTAYYVIVNGKVVAQDNYYVPANTNVDVTILVNETGNSANEAGEFYFDYSVSYEDGTSATGLKTNPYTFLKTHPAGACPVQTLAP